MDKSYGHQIWVAETARNSNSNQLVKSCDSDIYYPIKCQCCPHIGTSQLICCANQLAGFNMRATLTLNGLINFTLEDELYLHEITMYEVYLKDIWESVQMVASAGKTSWEAFFKWNQV